MEKKLIDNNTIDKKYCLYKLFVPLLIIFLLIVSCSSNGAIRLDPSYKEKSRNATVLSFIDKVSLRIDKYFKNENIILDIEKDKILIKEATTKSTATKEENKTTAETKTETKTETKVEEKAKEDKTDKEEIDKDLQDIPVPDIPEESNSDTLKKAIYSLYISETLTRSFIIEFRRRQSNFNLTPNILVSKKNIPLLKSSSRKKDIAFPIERNFSSVRKELGNNLVFELRILDMRITYDKPHEENPGFFATWAIFINVRGYLYDLEKGQTIWRSEEIESWSDTGVISFSSLLDNNSKLLKQTLKRIVDYSGKRLAIAFFDA